MTNLDAIYLAGFFDGEGCVMVTPSSSNRRHWYLHLVITNTNQPVMEWVHRTFGGCLSKRRGYTERCTNTWVWRAYSAEAATVLRLMLPYLKVKKEQAELALTFQSQIETHKRIWGRQQGGGPRGNTKMPDTAIQFRINISNKLRQMKRDDKQYA